MKIVRISFFLVLILTLTLVFASCYDAPPEERTSEKVAYQLGKVEDRIESQRYNDVVAVSNVVEQDRVVSLSYDTKLTVDGSLTSEEAEKIALEHAGVASDTALYLRTEPDREDGVLVFEVEFRVAIEDSPNYLEYEYTVRADNGTIIDVDKEIERYLD